MPSRQPGHQEPTLRMIAKEAGVHYATAAVVLNGARGNTGVSAETRARVLDVATRLGYRPNRQAQTLRRRKSMTVGLVAGSVENPFFARMAAITERVLREHGYDLVMVMDANTHGDDRALLEILLSRGVDGIIFWNERETEGRTMVEQGVGRPVVTFCYPSSRADSVMVDFRLGARLAVEHLIEQGHRRIGFFCPSEAVSFWTGNLRLCGYCDTVTEHGGVPLVYPYEGLLSDIESTREAAEALGRSAVRPDALFCFNDLVAIGAMMGLRRAGLRVPEDVALVGFDDIPLAAQLDVPLTTIDMPLDEVCRRAVDLLMNRLSGETDEAQVYVETTPKLIVRASSLAATK